MGFRVWDETVIFLDGWFVLIDSKGNNSVVSHNYARKREREYISYQTRMDITHAGFPPEDAYKSLAVVKDLPHNAVIAENAFADTEYARNNKSNS